VAGAVDVGGEIVGLTVAATVGLGVGADVGTAVGATVGGTVGGSVGAAVRTVGTGVGCGVGTGVGAGVAAARTMTVPVIAGPWTAQSYPNVPAALNVTVPDCPLLRIAVAKLPPLPRALCGT
jgi:hypothetical protein